MNETVELPSMRAPRWRVSPDDIARAVLRLQLTRKYDRRQMTRSDRVFVRRAKDLLRQMKPAPEGRPHRVSSTEVEIARLYEDLATLDSRPAPPARGTERARKLARLRGLQRAEADRSDRWLKAHVEFDPDAARGAMRRAEELIARHARPS